jgi:hypothetical protein
MLLALLQAATQTAKQAPQEWSITLGWRDILNIALAALAVYQFWRNRRTKEACRDVLERQATQTAAHGFAEMSRTAAELETWISKDEWDRSLELAKRMIVSLAEGAGAWSIILDDADQDNFDAARSEISSVEKFVSVAIHTSPPPAQKEDIKQRCMNASVYLAEIAGKLKKPSELKKPEPQKSKTPQENIEGNKKS